MKKIYEFYWDCGRMGHVEGIFSAEEANIKECIGKRIYFGEILGKHSEIYGDLKENDLKILTDDQEFIKKAEELKLIPSGYNPLDYISEEEE